MKDRQMTHVEERDMRVKYTTLVLKDPRRARLVIRAVVFSFDGTQTPRFHNHCISTMHEILKEFGGREDDGYGLRLVAGGN